MRLINTKTLELEEMMENEPVEYAILSHTWGKEEVSYQDMLNCNDEIRERKGYWKIQQCARIAAGQELAYIWVDTCCIDKSSSAELSEAINSMYRWYKNARICYAYLEDVVVYAGLSDMYSKDRFSKSRWFTRGWTLQELLAPLELVFYSGLWEQIGRKAEMHAELFTITGIPSYVIASGDLSVANVAQKMSWASKRETSRVEDVAYSLMGIFNVYMPVMYGEGERAFIRLQEKILECSDDHSLFAWRDSFVSKSSYRGLLASSPAEFASSGWIRPRPYSDWGLPMIDSHYSITNKGLCIKLPLAPCGSEDGLCIAVLDCYADSIGQIGIYLKRLYKDGNQFARVDPSEFCDRKHLDFEHCPNPETIYVRQNILLPENHGILRTSHILIRIMSSEKQERMQLNFWPPDRFDPTKMMISMPEEVNGCIGALAIQYQGSDGFVMVLGLERDKRHVLPWYNPNRYLGPGPKPGYVWCDVLPEPQLAQKELAKLVDEHLEPEKKVEYFVKQLPKLERQVATLVQAGIVENRLVSIINIVVSNIVVSEDTDH